MTKNMLTSETEISRLIERWNQGDLVARDRLLELIYDELRQLARRFFVHEPADHTLQPTAVVHELYLKLTERRTVHWRNRVHLFASIAEMMRKILVDYARRRSASKRGGQVIKLSLEEVNDLPVMIDPDILALDEALKLFCAVDERQSKIVVLRYFGGLKLSEIAEHTELSRATVVRELKLARLWLLDCLTRSS